MCILGWILSVILSTILGIMWVVLQTEIQPNWDEYRKRTRGER